MTVQLIGVPHNSILFNIYNQTKLELLEAVHKNLACEFFYVSKLSVNACLLPIYVTNTTSNTLANLQLYAQLKFPAEPGLSDRKVLISEFCYITI